MIQYSPISKQLSHQPQLISFNSCQAKHNCKQTATQVDKNDSMHVALDFDGYNILITQMITGGELHKKLSETVKAGKCTNKGCLSGCQDNVQIFWFGQQYPEKLVTCSSCYVMNDAAVQKSVPTALNVLPVSAFLNKFVVEMKVYQDFKQSAKWNPTDLATRQKEHNAELDAFELKLVGTLKALSVALEKFSRRAIEANSEIFNHQIFNEIIKIYSDDKMEGVLVKIQALIQYLNYGEDGKYRFYDQEAKTRKLGKLFTKIDQITQKILKALEDLLAQILDKNTSIAKV